MSDRPVTIYKITNMETGRCYVGATVGPILRRLRGHWNQTTGKVASKQRLHRSMQKHGFKTFCIEALAEAVNQREAIAIERAMIAEHNTLSPNGYNLSTGGEGSLGRHVSKETRQALREYRTGLKWSDESRAKASASHKGQKWTPEKRAVMNEIQTSDDYRAKMRVNSAKRAPTIHTAESRKKLSEGVSKYYADPEKRAAQSERIKAKYRDDSEYREKCRRSSANITDEERKRRSDRAKKQHQDPEFVKKLRSASALSHRPMTEDQKELRRVATKKMWSDPVKRAQIIAATKAAVKVAWDHDLITGRKRRAAMSASRKKRDI